MTFTISQDFKVKGNPTCSGMLFSWLGMSADGCMSSSPLKSHKNTKKKKKKKEILIILHHHHAISEDRDTQLS